MSPAVVLLKHYRVGQGVPFGWGPGDCLHWAAGVAIELTGSDPIPDLRGAYDSETAAARVMVSRGWRSLGDLAAERYREIPVASARTGDWALVVNADQTETIGVVSGSIVAGKARTGMTQVPRAAIARAFRVE